MASQVKRILMAGCIASVIFCGGLMAQHRKTAIEEAPAAAKVEAVTPELVQKHSRQLLAVLADPGEPEKDLALKALGRIFKKMPAAGEHGPHEKKYIDILKHASSVLRTHAATLKGATVHRVMYAHALKKNDKAHRQAVGAAEAQAKRDGKPLRPDTFIPLIEGSDEEMYRVIETYLAFNRTDIPTVKADLLKVVQRIGPYDATAQWIAMDAIEKFDLDRSKIAALFRGWLKAGAVSPLHIRRAVSRFPESPEIQNAVFEHLLAKDMGHLEDAERFALAYGRPGPKLAGSIIDLAIKSLNGGPKNGSPDWMMYPHVVLKNGRAYGAAFTEGHRIKTLLAIDRSKGVARTFGVWLLALDPNEKRFQTSLGRRVGPLLDEWAAVPTMPDIRDPQSRIHDLALLAMCPHLKLEQAELDKLRKMIELNPQSVEDFNRKTVFVRQHSGKPYVNGLAAFSMLWRHVKNPKPLFQSTIVGQMLVQEGAGFDYRSANLGYCVVFSRDRIGGWAGEPDLGSRPNPAKEPMRALETILNWPKSDYAKSNLPNIVEKAKTDATLRASLVENLWLRSTSSAPLAPIPGLREIVVDSIDKKHPDARINLQVAAIVGRVFGDKKTAIGLLVPVIKQETLAGHAEMRSWGPHVDLLVELAPEHPVLDELVVALKDAKVKGAEFVQWVLALRRNEKIGPFPAEAYCESWDNAHFEWIMFALARKPKAATPYLEHLRSPRILTGRAFAGLDSATRFHSKKMYKLLALLGAVDRIEWVSRGLPHLLPPLN